MTEQEEKTIRRWETKLKFVGNTDEDNVERATLGMKDTWIVTDFGRNLKGEFIYIVQPLENPSGMGEGVTGLWVFCLTREELRDIFEITT